MDILCECDDEACSQVIQLTMDEIIWLRSGGGDRLIKVPGHEEEEDVIVTTDSHGRFVVVISDL